MNAVKYTEYTSNHARSYCAITFISSLSSILLSTILPFFLVQEVGIQKQLGLTIGLLASLDELAKAIIPQIFGRYYGDRETGYNGICMSRIVVPGSQVLMGFSFLLDWIIAYISFPGLVIARIILAIGIALSYTMVPQASKELILSDFDRESFPTYSERVKYFSSVKDFAYCSALVVSQPYVYFLGSLVVDFRSLNAIFGVTFFFLAYYSYSSLYQVDSISSKKSDDTPKSEIQLKNGFLRLWSDIRAQVACMTQIVAQCIDCAILTFIPLLVFQYEYNKGGCVLPSEGFINNSTCSGHLTAGGIIAITQITGFWVFSYWKQNTTLSVSERFLYSIALGMLGASGLRYFRFERFETIYTFFLIGAMVASKFGMFDFAKALENQLCAELDTSEFESLQQATKLTKGFFLVTFIAIGGAWSDYMVDAPFAIIAVYSSLLLVSMLLIELPKPEKNAMDRSKYSTV